MVLTVRREQLSYPHVVTGHRRRMLEALTTYGRALWLRADDSATLYWREGGKTHQKTWKRFQIR